MSSIFDKEATISKQAGDIEKILIMQQREFVHYNVERYMNTSKGTSDYIRMKRRAKNSIKILLAKIDYPMMKKSPEKRKQIYELLDKEDYYEALKLINEYLLDSGLTSFYQKKIDMENVEEENIEKGL